MWGAGMDSMGISIDSCLDGYGQESGHGHGHDSMCIGTDNMSTGYVVAFLCCG